MAHELTCESRTEVTSFIVDRLTDGETDRLTSRRNEHVTN